MTLAFSKRLNHSLGVLTQDIVLKYRHPRTSYFPVLKMCYHLIFSGVFAIR